MMKQLKMLGLAALAVTAAACGSSSDPGPTPTPPFPQPTGTVAVNFSVDDSANKVYTAGQLQWKGAMLYDSTTRKITKDSNWGGPFATLYDDGPWSAGGHEPADAVAGDNKWGITVFVTPPATGSDLYEYGLIDHAFGDGWIWVGTNGSFTIAAAATAAVNAPGLTLPKFGTTDMQITIDKTALAPGTWDTSTVKVKGSAWGWQEITLTPSGNTYTFTLSNVVGAGKPLYHTGLLNSNDKPEFIFVFGTNTEYKDGAGNGLFTGVTAATKASTATTWSTATISLNAKFNPSITVP
jgi:hypothetical protein